MVLAIRHRINSSAFAMSIISVHRFVYKETVAAVSHSRRSDQIGRRREGVKS